MILKNVKKKIILHSLIKKFFETSLFNMFVVDLLCRYMTITHSCLSDIDSLLKIVKFIPWGYMLQKVNFLPICGINKWYQFYFKFLCVTSWILWRLITLDNIIHSQTQWEHWLLTLKELWKQSVFVMSLTS